VPQQTNNNSKGFWLPTAFSLVLILGMLIGIKLQKEVPLVPGSDRKPLTEAHPGKIEELLKYIEARYVDEVDREELVQKAIDNILAQLDPHSTYIPSDQLKRINEQLDGNFEGIGIEFLNVDDTIVVIKPMENGPSDKAGILAGDKIISVSGNSIVGPDLNEAGVVDSLRGKKGTAVKIGVIRAGVKDILYFDVVRGEIPINSVDASYMLNDNTGYIKINRFSSTTHTEFLDHLATLIDQEHLKNLIIDVRDNPGGYLQEATSILNQFFKEKDRLLVYTEGRNVHRNDYETNGKSFFSVDHIAVLVDEGSASASEILAGAIQDYDRGIIIGRRSFGKGLVQEQYGLKDGSAIRLTVARYYTPSGRSIQRSYDNIADYDQEINQRFESGELYNGKQLSLSDTTRYFTEEGRVVYGGGGIIPDVFVPLDSAKTNPYFVSIQPFIRSFIYKYYMENRPAPDSDNSMLTFSDMTNFIENYEIPEEVYHQFMESIDDEKLKIESRSISEVTKLTKLFLKARLAKHLFDDKGLYAVLNNEDDVVKKALHILQLPNPVTVLEDN